MPDLESGVVNITFSIEIIQGVDLKIELLLIRMTKFRYG